MRKNRIYTLAYELSGSRSDPRDHARDRMRPRCARQATLSEAACAPSLMSTVYPWILSHAAHPPSLTSSSLAWLMAPNLRDFEKPRNRGHPVRPLHTIYGWCGHDVLPHILHVRVRGLWPVRDHWAHPGGSSSGAGGSSTATLAIAWSSRPPPPACRPYGPARRRSPYQNHFMHGWYTT